MAPGPQQRKRDTYTNAPPVAVDEGAEAARTAASANPTPGAARQVYELGTAPAILWSPVTDARAPLSRASAERSVRCDLCAHRCVIRDGRLGICRVRENRGGRLVSLVYGEVVTAHVDPIEKKPLFHAFPGTASFSIATAGCNFHCPFCQNWEISQASREGFQPATRALSPPEVVREALATRSRSIAYTYIEPTVFAEYALDTARLAREAGLANVMVTNGYQTPEAIALMAPLIDAANVDLKAFSDRFYRRVCGARLQPILEAMKEMRRLGIWVEVTTLVIPGWNDSPEELGSAAEWIAGELGTETPWHISRFFPNYRWEDVPPTPVATLELAASLGRRAGLRHVYIGNVPGDGTTDTHCHRCGQLLIARRGYAVTSMRLVDGRCPGCAAPLAGIGFAA